MKAATGHEKEKETSQLNGPLEVLGSRPSPGVVKTGHMVNGVGGNTGEQKIITGFTNKDF